MSSSKECDDSFKNDNINNNNNDNNIIINNDDNININNNIIQTNDDQPLTLPFTSLDLNSPFDNAILPSEFDTSKYIKTFASSKGNLYGITFQYSSPDITIATSTMNISPDNTLHILTSTDESTALTEVTSTSLPYPPSKLLFSPHEQNKNLLIASSDTLYLYNYTTPSISLLNTFKRTDQVYNGPLTSCDWATASSNVIAVASVDTTVSVIDVETMEPKIIFIAYDKEVYDISFGPDEFTFVTTGADGSMRMFDTRSTDVNSIIFETNDGTPMTNVKWNLSDPNFILSTVMDKNDIYILDQRNTSVPYAILKDHNNVVNNAVWAPELSSMLCSVSDDKTALIWDVYTESITPAESVMVYNAVKEVENVAWVAKSEEWVGIVYGNCAEILKVK
jgi:WD40 repeat protein